jgi:hypothetical protein
MKPPSWVIGKLNLRADETGLAADKYNWAVVIAGGARLDERTLICVNIKACGVSAARDHVAFVVKHLDVTLSAYLELGLSHFGSPSIGAPLSGLPFTKYRHKRETQLR